MFCGAHAAASLSVRVPAFATLCHLASHLHQHGISERRLYTPPNAHRAFISAKELQVGYMALFQVAARHKAPLE